MFVLKPLGCAQHVERICIKLLMLCYLLLLRIIYMVMAALVFEKSNVDVGMLIKLCIWIYYFSKGR